MCIQTHVRIVGSYINYMCNHLGSYQTVVQSSCILFHSYHQSMSLLISPYPHSHLIQRTKTILHLSSQDSGVTSSDFGDNRGPFLAFYILLSPSQQSLQRAVGNFSVNYLPVNHSVAPCGCNWLQTAPAGCP